MSKTQKLEHLLSDLSMQYRAKYGHDWLYTNCKIRHTSQGYFVEHSDWQRSAWVGRYDRAVRFLRDYLETGKPNDTLRRYGS